MNITFERLQEIEQELIRRCELYIDNWPGGPISFFSTYETFDKNIGMFQQCKLRDWMLANEWMPFIQEYEYKEMEYFILSYNIFEHYKNNLE
jgi:hypothetical protein